MKGEEPRRTNWAHSRPSMVSATAREYDFKVGYILTTDGAVGLYAQADPPMTSLSMVVGGRHLSSTWERTFTDRYLKTLATRFAAEHVAALTHQGGENA